MKPSLIILTFVISTLSAHSQDLKLGLPIGHNLEILSVDFSPDGKYIVTTSLYTTKVWETESGKLLYNLPFLQTLEGFARSSRPGKWPLESQQ